MTFSLFNLNRLNSALRVTLLATIPFSAMADDSPAPGSKFDLRFWNITLPMDANKDNKVDTVKVKELQDYAHPDYFFLDEEGYMVFQSPNKALTTANSSNTRSELRQMLRSTNTRIKTKEPKNNFALASNKDSDEFGLIGGRMIATLKVNHVSVNAKYPEKNPAFSVVIGQIHAGKDETLRKGYGAGNEPLKIYYKKLPGHDTGSVFWNYERNLSKEDPNRTDITYPVWGNTWENREDPGEAGVALGEEFSYSVNVFGDIMTLHFVRKGYPIVTYEINLADNVDAYGNVDEYDHPGGYTGDWMYFKAGAYNQCSSNDDSGFWYTACPGSGDWETDKANGDYVSVAFSRLQLSQAVDFSESQTSSK